MNTARTTFNEAQLQILELMSFVKTQQGLEDLKMAVSNYFAEKAERELNAMWDSGQLSEERIESFRHLHERTPYCKPALQHA